jgi:hypothetical protein
MMDSVNQLSWLAGAWKGENDGGSFEEVWLAPKAGTLLGLSRTIQGGELRTEEFMRIGLWDGKLCFATVLKLKTAAEALQAIEIDHEHALFGNPEDPKNIRVLYKRTNSGLYARVSGIRETKPWALEFDFVPA